MERKHYIQAYNRKEWRTKSKLAEESTVEQVPIEPLGVITKAQRCSGLQSENTVSDFAKKECAYTENWNRRNGWKNIKAIFREAAETLGSLENLVVQIREHRQQCQTAQLRKRGVNML